MRRNKGLTAGQPTRFHIDAEGWDLFRGSERAITAGPLFAPSPRRLDNRIQIRHGGLPPQERLCAGGISDKLRGVTRPRTFDSSANWQPSDTTSCFDHLENGVPASGAEIDRVGCAALAKVVESPNVRVGQVRNVNVVTNGGAIRCRISVPEYSHFFLGIGRGCKNVRNQVSFGIMILATALSGACRVKIAQADRFQTVCCVIDFEKTFQSELRPAIRILRPLRGILSDGRFLLLPVDSARG